jgi:hypothetical protein
MARSSYQLEDTFTRVLKEVGIEHTTSGHPDSNYLKELSTTIKEKSLYV